MERMTDNRDMPDVPKPLYTDYAAYLRRHFAGKVQKLSVDAGFSCPNRDGTLGRGGCSYCNNRTFSPAYTSAGLTVTRQIEEGRRFFARKYPAMGYLAYFQSYTNTYGRPDEALRLYEEALSADGVEGLVIGTRPDCMPQELLDALARLGRDHYIMVEYGVESVCDETLRRVNRGHTFAQSVTAIGRTHAAGLQVGVHLLFGLPGETRATMLAAAGILSRLPVDTVKLHQLQIVRQTPMAREYAAHPERFALFTPEDYAVLVCDFLERLDPRIAVERFTAQSPRQWLVAPDWGMKNHEFTALVQRELRRRGTRQGFLFAPY